jgi:hypothetical protein
MPARPSAASFRAGAIIKILKYVPIDLAHHVSGHEYKGSSSMYEYVDASRPVAIVR